MSAFHPATSSLANFKNTISTISTSRFLVYISSRQEPTFVMASQLELCLPANSYTTHLLSSTRATNEAIAVLEVWSIFPFAIKRILGIKRIFPCSFANKRMRLLTRVYGIMVYSNFLTTGGKSGSILHPSSAEDGCSVMLFPGLNSKGKSGPMVAPLYFR